MKFDICIVVHNCLDEFEKCMKSVRAINTELSGHTYSLWVWDNNSDDEGLLRRMAEGCAVTRCKRNRGFSAPADFLARAGDGDIILFLNPDAVLPPDALDKLAAPFMSYEMVGAVGPRGGCRTIQEDGVGSAREGLDYIEGACLAVRRAEYLEVGGFDHEYYHFAYCEDADLCLKLRRKGYKLVEVDLPGYEHGRASTTELVKERNTVDIDGFRVINQLRLKRRWRDYMSRWTFKRTFVLKRSAAIGDCLQLTALARALQWYEPEWKVYADTPWPELFEHNPFISAWEGANERVEHVDLDMAYETFPMEHLVDGYLKALGIKPEWPAPPPEVYFTDDELGALSLVPKREPYAVVHAEPTNWPGRDWPLSRFNEVVQGLGMQVLQVGSVANPDTALYGVTDCRGFDLRTSMALISKARWFVGVDSFPSTVASACDVPGVVLFGAITPSKRLARQGPVGLIPTGFECLGCHHEHPAPATFSGCIREPEAKVAPCMRSIVSGDVLFLLETQELKNAEARLQTGAQG